VSDKHQTYFELRDALARPGCVVCRLAARSVRRYLEALSFESVNDHGLRAELRRARGFCNLHAWQLLDDVRDPFGTGIIYRDVLNHCARLVEAGRIDALAPERPCPGCVARDEAAARYVDVLGEHLRDAAFGESVEAAGALCWRHFALAVARGGTGVRQLAAIEVRVLRRRDRATVAAPGSSARPAPGIRAGNAAPRPAPDEVVGDDLVARAVGLPGVVGTALDRLDARDWGGGPLAGADAVLLSVEDECAACGVGRAAAEAAIGRLGSAPPGPLELCAPHAWRATQRIGADGVRARLAPMLDHLAERVEAARDDFARAMSLRFGPFEIATPAAGRVRLELARRVAPGHGCSVCAAQVAAEDNALPSGPLCRVHALTWPAAVPFCEEVSVWRGIVADLDEYIRKNDYRFRGEPRGEEQRSPWRAVAMVAGARGLR
jgi:hypothetical protein